ncbi:MAG: acyl-CoA dehydratase activase [Deltaproteobacteria bacterium]|jgi:predicted CoA-substrate-specific enzyme activase|nr:acyl-CoA dehydratase activase [Deltaproteobacteria bacterium]
MDLRVGLDLGSAAIKAAFVEAGEMIWRDQTATAPEQARLAEALIRKGFDELGLPKTQSYGLASTGYGRRLYDAADAKLDEIGANARGLFKLSQGQVRTAVNIGGQDLKTLKISETGKVSDFRMNDKCAAGTGRFFELAARLLDVPLDKFHSLAQESGPTIELNSTCVVFAETEIVSLMSRGVQTSAIIKALHRSVARRAASLLGGVDDDCVWLDGGPAMNRGLVEALEDELLTEVKVAAEPQYTVAYGAALSLD